MSIGLPGKQSKLIRRLWRLPWVADIIAGATAAGCWVGAARAGPKLGLFQPAGASGAGNCCCGPLGWGWGPLSQDIGLGLLRPARARGRLAVAAGAAQARAWVSWPTGWGWPGVALVVVGGEGGSGLATAGEKGAQCSCCRGRDHGTNIPEGLRVHLLPVVIAPG